MAVNKGQYLSLKAELESRGVQLVAVSKMQPAENILRLYEWGHRDFGENYVQELLEKEAILPKDIRWHFIGHLQSNKVKYIVPFIHLIHGVDSLKLLKEIERQGEKIRNTINVLLQVHIASEETKFGLDGEELAAVVTHLEVNKSKHILVKGLMGMASFSEDEKQLRSEFNTIRKHFSALKKRSIDTINAETLSIGMSSDYKIAVEEGSTMVRIGSALFGSRTAK